MVRFELGCGLWVVGSVSLTISKSRVSRARALFTFVPFSPRNISASAFELSAKRDRLHQSADR